MRGRDETKAPFAAHTNKLDKRRAGRTTALATQLEIRSGGMDIEPGLRTWIYERIGRQLGKYAPQIERVQVRFGDENGPKGGQDKCCLVHVILSKLPPVVVEIRGETEQQAFDLAAARAERAVRRNMEKHGFSTHHHQHKHHSQPPAMAGFDGMSFLEDGADGSAANVGSSATGEEGLIGAREGHRTEQAEALVGQPESQIHTAQPGSAADDMRVGADHTATRNVKSNTSGMAYSLEDSSTGKPSRKSTRRGTNRIKHGNPLTLRTKAAVQGPKEVAARAAVHKG